MLITIDGLDYSGKSTCAKIISDLTGFEYVKIKRGSILDYRNCKTEEQITLRIIQEISEGVKDKSKIVLDRSYLSALITGTIYDSSMEINKLLPHIPPNLLFPKLALIVTVPHRVAKSRINGRMTKQDEIILNSNYDDHVKTLEMIAREKRYIIFSNDSNQNEKELRTSLENLLSTHFY